MKRIDLTGQRFGRLVVDCVSGVSKNGSVIWLCTCDCGASTSVDSNKLRTGHTKSCGCLKRDYVSNQPRKKNEYKFMDNYCVGVTSNTGAEFWFDIDDFNVVSEYTWFETDQGYIAASISGKICRMHRVILHPPDDTIIDHINRNRKDNRKENLRTATKQQNGINRGANVNSKTKAKGVSYEDKTERYWARICIDGKTISIGYSDTLEGAIQLRQAYEKNYFGEFAYNGLEEVVLS